MRIFLRFLFLLAILSAIGFFLLPGVSVSNLRNYLPLKPKIDAATGKPLIECPTCRGTKVMPCTQRGCVEGKVECNGPCMRLTKGTWIKDAKLGHGPDELWQAFRTKRGTQYYSQLHIGEVVEMRDGEAVNIGRCKICNGTTRVPCKACQGSATIPCTTCKGSGEIPDMNAASSKGAKPAAASGAPASPAAVSASPPKPPENIRLKNGTSILGNITIRTEEIVIIRTPDGKTTQIPVSDLAP